VVALRALGYLGGEVSNAGGEGETPSGSSRRSRRRFRPAPVAEPAAQTQMDADRRERVGVNPKRVSCCARRDATTCSTSARDVAKFAPSGEAVAGSRVCEALGLALAGGRATAPTPSDSVYIEGFTGAADRDFHAAATGAWWGDHADLARASDRAAFHRLARALREDGERQGFATFATRAGSWCRFACPACQDAARAAARRLGEPQGDARASAAAELDVRDAFASFTAAESASAWEVLETCEAEARARGWKPAGEGGSA